jgi:Regulator of chromosome condensation (RCC1) repeat/Divergent InlB B-repeat domain
MPHRLTHVVTLIATLTTAAVWDATAFAQVGPPWHGSATCHAHASSNTTSYTNDEWHSWDIVFPQVPGSTGSFLLYVENWKVTGSGGNSQYSWKTSGGNPGGKLSFRVDIINNMLHIGRFTAAMTDPQGTKVTPNNGGASFFTAVGEILFPNITADPNSNSVVGSSTTTITNTTGNFFLAPGDSTVTTTCSWHFTTLLSREPGTLSKPGDATPGRLAGVGTPPKEDKPTPGSIRPPVPTTLSIFFGGPGNGSVTSPRFSCVSDCVAGDVSQGITVTLTAAPDAASVFAGWGGSCSGTSITCSVTLGASNSVIAYFRSKFKTVAAGAYHSCALRPAGDVVCWGRNEEGQIGTGTFPSATLPPSSVTGFTNAVAIASGGFHTCALLVGGTITCWGKNNDGQLGNPSSFPTISATPTIVPGIIGALAVTAGGAHTCVVLAGGSASCWGLNGDSQLGASTPSNHSPTPLSVMLGAAATKQIAAGAYHTCAIVADSTVICWGSNSDGQAGGRVTISDTGGPGLAEGCIIPPVVVIAYQSSRALWGTTSQ